MEQIQIRNLQHYLYCPHRWGLIEIDKSWAENFFVVKSNALHDRVHSGDYYTTRGKKVFTNIDVWDDSLGLIGKVDCVEDKGGRLCIVEYKPTKSKAETIRHEDAMQLFAQKICLEQMFHAECDTVIYYSDIKKRFAIDFSADFEAMLSELKQIISEMQHFIKTGTIPPIRRGQKCSGCSMKDMCMPSVLTRRKAAVIKNIIEEENDL